MKRSLLDYDTAERLNIGSRDEEQQATEESASDIQREAKIEFIIHTKDTDIDPWKVDFYQRQRDYVTNIGDYITVGFSLLADTYLYDIMPNRGNLEISIIKTIKQEITIRRYKLMLDAGTDNTIAAPWGGLSRDEIEGMSPIYLTGQCVDRELETIVEQYVDGIYQEATVDDVIKYECEKIKTKCKVEGSPVNFVINVEPPHNVNRYKHIIVPTGTKFIDLPGYLQATNYGVYNSTIGFYFQYYKNKFTAFVYALDDVDKYTKSKYKLNIYNTRNLSMRIGIRTFGKQPNILNIVATNGIESRSIGGVSYFLHGNTVGRSKPNTILNQLGKVTNDKIMVDETTIMESTKHVDMEDGNEKVNYVPNEINMFKHRAQVKSRELIHVKVQWPNGDLEQIYPGMPAKLHYEQDGKIEVLFGVVQMCAETYLVNTKKLTGMIVLKMSKSQKEQP